MRVFHTGDDWVLSVAIDTVRDRVVALVGDRDYCKGVRIHSMLDDEPQQLEYFGARAALAPSGAALALVQPPSRLGIWPLDPPNIYGTAYHSPSALGLRFAPDEQRLYVLARDLPRGTIVRGYDLAAGRTLPEWHVGGNANVLAVRHDEQVIALHGKGFVAIHETASGDQLLRWPVESDGRYLVFSPSGKVLAIGAGPFVQLWDAATGQQIFSLVGHRSRVTCVAFSPDGRTLVTGSTDRTVKTWDLNSGKLTRTYEWPTGPVRALALAPDGLTAAAGGESGDIVVWDVEH